MAAASGSNDPPVPNPFNYGAAGNIPEDLQEVVKNAVKWAQHFSGVDFEEWMQTHRQESASGSCGQTSPKHHGKHHGRHGRHYVPRCPYMTKENIETAKTAALQVPELIGAVMSNVYDWLQPVDPSAYNLGQMANAVPTPGASAPATGPATCPRMCKKPQQPAQSPGHFEISIDVSGFSPEEISVKIVDNYLLVEAKKEAKEKVIKQIQHKYLIPGDIDSDTIKSIMKDDSVLIVMGRPKVQKKEIPVQIIRGPPQPFVDTLSSSSSGSDQDLASQAGYERVEKPTQTTEMTVD